MQAGNASARNNRTAIQQDARFKKNRGIKFI
jgi:hypothetical protein